MRLENLQAVVLGKSGTGKSVYSRYLLYLYMTHNPEKKIIVIDESLDNWRIIKNMGFKKMEIDDTIDFYAIDYKKLIQNHQKIFIEITRLLPEEIADFLDLLCLEIYHEKNTLLFLDEGHKFYWSNLTGQGQPAIELQRLFTGGRKAGIDIILTSQMIVDLNIRSIKQANLLVSFQLTEENELKKIGSYFDNGYNLLPILSRGGYLIKNLLTGKQKQKNSYNIKNINLLV